MLLTHSLHVTDFDNRPLSTRAIRKIKLSQIVHWKGSLWVIHFYDTNNRRVGKWFYRSEQHQKEDVCALLRINPLVLMF